MGGRVQVRRHVAAAIPVAVLALVLVVLPSLGSGLVPAAVVRGASPSATVVHLLGDEVAPASISASPERRGLLGAPDLVVALLVTAAGLIAATATWLSSANPHRVVVPVVSSSESGRSPPRRFPAP